MYICVSETKRGPKRQKLKKEKFFINCQVEGRTFEENFLQFCKACRRIEGNPSSNTIIVTLHAHYNKQLIITT